MSRYDHLDRDALVRLLQRRDAERQLGLVEGDGYYPDFIVCLRERVAPGIALLEVKGDHLWGKDSEVEKSAAAHRDYGTVFMAGRKRGDRDFVLLRNLEGRLQSAGAFSVDRLRFP